MEWRKAMLNIEITMSAESGYVGNPLEIHDQEGKPE